MRSSFILLATVVASATASLAHYPADYDFAEILRRQAPGSPEYECHADCGGVIVIGRTENYCENATFTEGLEACLECAVQYDVWEGYGDSVSAAAEACGLEAVPLSANATTTGEANSTSVVTPTTAAATSGASLTGAATTATAEATAASTNAAETASGTGSAPAATSSFPGAGNQVIVGSALFLVPLGLLLTEWL